MYRTEVDEFCFYFGFRESYCICITLHFVRDLIEKGFIEIFHIPTKLQVAYMLTKALSAQVFPCHIDTLLGKPHTGDLLHYLTNLISTINAMSYRQTH
jgi:hypothetical protein